MMGRLCPQLATLALAIVALGEGCGREREVAEASAANSGGISAEAGTAVIAGAGGRATASGGRVGLTGAGASVASAGAGSPANTDPSDASERRGNADAVWFPLSVMQIVNPRDHGTRGDGQADDGPGLSAAIGALPQSGGIVYLPPDSVFKKTKLLVVTTSHVKFWAPNRQARVVQNIAGQRREQSILCRNTTGCGFFGLKIESDANARFDALEDNQISVDGGSLVEVVGCEIQNSAATGVFLYGSSEHYIYGNYIHHTWADHIHHTNGARRSWVWNNFIINAAPSKGDDGIACVTYGPSSARCGEMEWWANSILHTDWGRGYAVIGGDDIHIHHNWAIGVAGAGVIVASESSFKSASSRNIRIERNAVAECGHTIGHPGILISGENPAAEPLSEITLRDNVSTDTRMGEPYRAEGEYTAVTNMGLQTTRSALPAPKPTLDDVRLADTSVLRTFDISHVAGDFRPGLLRIHVRRQPGAEAFQQRMEYVIRGPSGAVESFTQSRVAEGDHLSEQRALGSQTYALLLTAQPLRIASGLSGVGFSELRAGDLDGRLGWLWRRVDNGDY